MKTKLAAATLVLSIFASLSASAQDAMVKGEVKKIDKAAGKITLNHGPIKNLDMTDENMTMVFHVQDLAMLKQVKVGDSSRPNARRPALRSRNCKRQNRRMSGRFHATGADCHIPRHTANSNVEQHGGVMLVLDVQ